MSEQTEAIKAASRAHDDAVQALADLTGEHIESALGMYGVVYYKFYHPVSCPERVKQQLPAHDDIPDVFKRMFDNGALPDEPKPEGGA